MKKMIFFLLLSFLFSCKKVKVETNSIITNLTLSKKNILADGTTKITISARLNPDADASHRTIIFTTSSGNFINGLNGSISVKADFDHDTLIAKAIITAPTTASNIYISARPDLNNSKNYTLYDTIYATFSSAASLVLTPSFLGLKNNFQNEDTIRGLLSNSFGLGVSIGTKVIFEDYLNNGNNAMGKYRIINNYSDASSAVYATYSIGNIPIGTQIDIIGTVLDASGIKTNVKDTIQLTIIQ